MRWDRKVVIMSRLFIVVIVTIVIISVVLIPLTRKPEGNFSLQVTPNYMRDSVIGQKCIFLVTVTNESDGGAVSLSVSVQKMGSASVEPTAIKPGEVAEVTVIPNMTSDDENMTVVITGRRGDIEEQVAANILVNEGEIDDELKEMATKIQDLFVPWLSEFGISNETEWEPVLICPHIMVVMYYTFYSEEWEMGVCWHVTIEPHNWARIYLRHRFNETKPSHAYEISTWTSPGEPHDWDLPENVWR